MTGRSTRGRARGDPRRGAGAGRGEPLMPSGRRGLVVFGAASRCGSPPASSGRRGWRSSASASPRCRSSPARFVRWGRQRGSRSAAASPTSASRRVRASPCVSTSRTRRRAVTPLLLARGPAAARARAARRAWSSRAYRRTARRASPTRSLPQTAWSVPVGPAHGRRLRPLRADAAATGVRRARRAARHAGDRGPRRRRPTRALGANWAPPGHGSCCGPARSTTRCASTSEGDDLRRIHWPSVARTGELMIRQDESSRRASGLVFLDNRRPCARAGPRAGVRARGLGRGHARRAARPQRGFALRLAHRRTRRRPP